VVERLATKTLWVPGGTLSDGWMRQDRSVVDDLYDGVPPQLPPRQWQHPSAQRRPAAQASHGSIYDSEQRAVTFRLLELHGAVSWSAAPDDPTGATLAHWVSPSGEPGGESQRRRNLPGREPFIVPPSTRKLPYLGSRW